jgi:hypothetical protein
MQKDETFRFRLSTRCIAAVCKKPSESKETYQTRGLCVAVPIGLSFIMTLTFRAILKHLNANINKPLEYEGLST